MKKIPLNFRNCMGRGQKVILLRERLAMYRKMKDKMRLPQLGRNSSLLLCIPKD